MSTPLPPCIGERLRDVLADIRFAAYEAAWEAAHPPVTEDSNDDQEANQPA